MIKSDELAKGATGCLAKAADDEMLFILRAQDFASPQVVLEWIKLNFNSCSEEKLMEAFKCALQMREHVNRKAAD